MISLHRFVACCLTVLVSACPPDEGGSGDAGPSDPGVDMATAEPDTGATGEDMGEDLGAERGVASVLITPAELSLELGTTGTLVAAALDADEQPVSGSSTSWESSAPDVVEVTDTGVVIARAIGGATVTATIDGVSGNAVLEVVGPPVDRMEISPRSRTMAVGDTVTMNVSLFDAFNAPIDDERDTTFTSMDESVVTVDDVGLVTAVSEGSTTVDVTVEGLTESANFTVTGDTLLSIAVTPTSTSLVRGETAQFAATATYEEAGTVSIAPTWSTVDAAIATVDATGLVTGVGKGATTVRAEFGGQAQTATVTVEFAFGALSAGAAHACGIASGGVAWCWGSAGSALGHGQGAGPAPVDTTMRFDRIAASTAHTCGIASDGSAWCWGTGTAGQLGDGLGADSTAPVAVAGGRTFTALVAAPNGTCAVAAGELFCWGEYAGLSSVTPVSLGSYTGAGVGADHACGSSGSTGHCRGDNTYGQLGLNVAGGSYSSWTAVTGGFDFESFGAGTRHSCGTTTGGAILCWGDNSSGQVGDSSTTQRVTPILIAAPVTLSRLSVGAEHNCALDGSGNAYCWGDGTFGKLGNGSTSGFVDEPTAVSTSTQFTTISAGTDFTCAVASDGTPWCWGAGADGQLGTGSMGSPTPIEVSGF